MSAPVFDIARIGPGEGSEPPRTRLRSDAPAQPLDGTWQFRVSASVLDIPDDTWLDGTAGVWSELVVPGHWNLNGFGLPAYSNVQFPFPIDPPHPPDHNPIGDYRRAFSLDPGLAAAAAVPGSRILLRFDGIESAADVFLNGERLGSTRGSRLTHEFDVTGIVRPAGNVIGVRVAKFSDATYLENQDMWWLPGIFRSVELLARPSGGIDDAFVTADYDPATGRGELAVRVAAEGDVGVRIHELGIDTVVRGTGPGTVDTALAPALVEAGEVSPWSAETPRLYDVVLSTAAERVSLRVGFRRVESADGILTVNGRPVTLRGVNRHEHDPEHGRVHSEALARRDIELMKQHNINAVRTSHYPPHPDFLDLADEYGLYLIDECDLETHEYEYVEWRGNPSTDPAWREAFLDRIRRTVTRDRNHPSVILWSLGNESGAGSNITAMADWVRGHDPSRLIHYEGDWSSRDVDVYSRMYPSHEEVRRIGEEALHPAAFDATADEVRRRGLPFILCEFGHAMGNSPGGVKEYWELVERYPRIAGAFVWEWVEHGIAVRDETGRRLIRYGGDFGESVHDHNFVIDGLVSADRELRPGLVDYAAIIAPVVFEITADRRAAAVINRYDHIDLSHLRVCWRRERDGVVVAEGELEVATAPRRRTEVALPPAARDDRAAPEVADVLTLEAALRDETSWASPGHVVARGQHVRAGAPAREDGVAPAAHLFDRRARPLVLGTARVVDPPRLGIWRAPTDNDRAAGWDEPDLPPYAERWATARMDRMLTRLRGTERDDLALTAWTRDGTPSYDAAIDAVWAWRAVEDGMLLHLDIEPHGPWEVDWARLGIDLALEGAPVGLDFAGYGPGPSYPDTDSGVHFGWHRVGASDLVTPHVRPQESGSRRGVRDATIRTETGDVRVRVLQGGSTDAGVAITVSPWDRRTLADTTHASLLPAPTATHLSIDIAQSGVGTATCGPGVLPRYRVPAFAASVRLLFSPA